MRYTIAALIIVSLFGSCKEKADPLTEKTYTADKVGWTINLPGKKWKTMSEKEVKKINERGMEFIKEATNTKIDTSESENLISLKKDPFNYFFALIEPFDSVTFRNYDDMITAVHEITKASFESKKIPVEFEMGATRIDGLMLDRYIIKLLSKKHGENILNQELYTCLINNYVLTINLVYNNELDKETLQSILQSSNFTMNSKL
jgi:hypothetical protein